MKKSIKQLVEKQRQFYLSGKTKAVDFRLQQLEVLKAALEKNEKNIYKALEDDFKKPVFETYLSEIGIPLDEISITLKNLRPWVKPEKVHTGLVNFPGDSYIHAMPYGVALIIGAWNYPFQLTINPMVGAMAAGNCVILKPSEISGHTSALIAKIMRDHFDEQYVAVAEGDAEISKALLEEQLDYIFFTGSEKVGKIVMEAAAKHLTPVTLELGGKSPAIVDHDADLKLAAKRIVWGKFLNAGQTCVAPDYLIVHTRVKKDMLIYMNQYIREFYGDDPFQSEDYSRIINDQHFDRLTGLLNKGSIVKGGESNKKERYIAPTVIDDITWDSPIMQEEIFGPVLPVLEYDRVDDVINQINARPRPLSLYFFSESKASQDRIVQEINFGGGCINDTVAHFANPELPFGGVGSSGMGNYHGKASFDTFSHKKSILKKSTWIDVPLRYPPYEGKLKWVKKILK